jgi:hypothetical protein
MTSVITTCPKLVADYWDIATREVPLSVDCCLAISVHAKDPRHFAPDEPLLSEAIVDDLSPETVREAVGWGWDQGQQRFGEHRILLPQGHAHISNPSIAILGYLRHELEHARQWEHWGERAEDLRALENELYQQMLLYIRQPHNKMPSEQAANAAAAVLMQEVDPKEMAQLGGTNDSQLLGGKAIHPGELVTEILHAAQKLDEEPSQDFMNALGKHSDWLDQWNSMGGWRLGYSLLTP